MGNTLTLSAYCAEDENESDDTATVNFSAEGYTSVSLKVICRDNDAQRILLANSPTSISEGTSATANVRLSLKPSNNVTVNLQSNTTSSMTVSPASLIFTPENYSTAQTITLNAVEDSNSIAETVSISFTSTGLNSVTATVLTIDNDLSPVFSVSSPLSIAEGANSSFTLRLSGAPGTSRIVSLQTSPSGILSLDVTTATFDSSNWNTPITITATAAQDANASNENVTITAGGEVELAPLL